MLPAYALMAYPVKDTALWQYAVPFLSQNQMIQKITRGESATAGQWGIYLAASLGLALLLWFLERARARRMAAAGRGSVLSTEMVLLLAVLAVSVIVGLIRGFVFEVPSVQPTSEPPAWLPNGWRVVPQSTGDLGDGVVDDAEVALEHDHRARVRGGHAGDQLVLAVRQRDAVADCPFLDIHEFKTAAAKVDRDPARVRDRRKHAIARRLGLLFA